MSIKESALSVITSIAQGDFIRAVTSDGNSRKVTVANLAKAINTNALQVHSATIASGVSGQVLYVHFGRICVFGGYVSTSSALTAGHVLCSGLPALGVYPNFCIRANNNNSTTEFYDLIVGEGNLKNKVAQAAASRNLRFSGCYITANEA